jgi:hypothetical protein
MPTATTFLCATSLALLAGCWTPTQAQTSADSTTTPRATKKATRPRYLRLSVGTIPDTYWTYRCLKVGIEYAPMLTKHLGVAGRLVGLAGHPTSSDPAYGPWIDQVPNQNCRAAYAEAEALYYPIGVSHRVRFAVGLGGFAGYYRNNAYTSGLIVAGQANWFELATYQGSLVGYLGSLNLEVALGQQRRWALGAKLTRQKGGGGITNLPGQSLTLARQF